MPEAGHGHKTNGSLKNRILAIMWAHKLNSNVNHTVIIFLTALLFLNTAATATAEEERQHIKFICNSPHTVPTVVMMAESEYEDLIHGISTLPNGCQWVTGEGTIHETVQLIDVPGEPWRYARISRVTINGLKGYSAGLTELIM